MPRPRIKLCYVVLGFWACLTSCGRGVPAETQREKQTRMTLGTIVQVDICYDAATSGRLEPAYQKVWDLFEQRTRLWNGYDTESEVSAINRSYPGEVMVSPATLAILNLSRDISRSTDGTFDLTMKPLLDLWRTAAEQGRVPDRHKLAALQAAVGPDQVLLSPRGTVRLAGPLTRIDLGGIAKGFAVDEAAAVLRGEGFFDFLIDAGGDMYAGGKNCRGEKWRIGVRDPRDRKKIKEILRVSDRAVTTSGSYEQNFKVAGEAYSHILDPAGGRPLPAQQPGARASVTVVSGSAAWADGLSTAFSVFPVERTLRFIEQSEQQPLAVLIFYEADTAGRLKRLASPGLAEYE